MKRIEVLLISSANGTRVLDVFLHDPVAKTVLREDYDTFLFRSVLPHEERLEMRSINVMDDRLDENFWCLRQIPKDSIGLGKEHHIAFREIFLIGTGFYCPNHPRKYTSVDADETITKAAVVFPLTDSDNHIYAEVALYGERHSDCFRRASACKLNYNHNLIRQGFLTDHGRIISREEAKALARINGQLKKDTFSDELFSEDLW